MRNTILPAALLMPLLAIAAWAGVWFLFSDVSSRVSARAEDNSTALVQDQQMGSAIELHALAADTILQRAALDRTVDTDIVGIADAISAAGSEAGVRTTIGSASVVRSFPSPANVNEVAFVVQTNGTFAEVWRAAESFYSLPLPSSVSDLEFKQAADSSGQWQLTARIEVLTSAQVSS